MTAARQADNYPSGMPAKHVMRRRLPITLHACSKHRPCMALNAPCKLDSSLLREHKPVKMLQGSTLQQLAIRSCNREAERSDR